MGEANLHIKEAVDITNDVKISERDQISVTSQESNNDNLMDKVVSSENEAYSLYNDYALRIGFSIRKGKSRYFIGSKNIRQREYLCSKEGFKIDEDLCEEKKVNKLETRSGCKAFIRFTVEDGIWRVTAFNPMHNHELALPSERHLLRSGRHISRPKADAIISMVNSGISTKTTCSYLREEVRGNETSERHLLRSGHHISRPKADAITYMVNAGISTKPAYSYLREEVGGNVNVGFTKRDCYNCVNKQTMMMISAGDSQSLLNHFKHKHAEDPMFFYTVQVDQENRMTNFFWRDGRAKFDYDCFGDVVVFNTTYRTNKYNLICAPFVGVNHHMQNVMFGCAFLLDETTNSFIWLFKSFLESMGNHTPVTIFTDQDQAMSDAIEKVFPTTHHRLCLSHISRKTPSHLGELNAEPEFKYLFNKCQKRCESELEFQCTWDKMMQKFNLGSDRWLNMLYEIRFKWSTAFAKDNFTAEFQFSSRSESTNHVLDGIANKTTSLTEFVIAYDNLVAGMHSNELDEDFRCKQGVPQRAVKKSGILGHAAQVYTSKIFKLFEKEFLNSLAMVWKQVDCNDILHVFEVCEEDSERVCTVHFNPLNSNISCSCKKFESLGILCCHALRVFSVKNLTGIPSQYILKRWTKEAKKGMMAYEQSTPSPMNDKEAKVMWCNSMIRIASTSIYKSQEENTLKHICQKRLLELDEEIERELAKLKSGKDANVEEVEPIQCDTTSDIHCLHNEMPVLDPPHMNSKGAQNTRLEGHFEKRKTKASKEATSTRKMKQQVTKGPLHDSLSATHDPTIFQPPSHSIVVRPASANLYGHLYMQPFSPLTMHTQVMSHTNIPFSNMLQGANIVSQLTQVNKHT